jgi:hypothetical protein
MSKSTESIEVAVVGENANGAPEIMFYTISCGAEAISNGEHYDLARAQALANGYEPKVAFDSTDPAWAIVREQRRYKAFFTAAFETLQGTFVGQQSCSGADTVDAAAQLFVGALSESPVRLYLAASADGYWNNHDGWGGSADHAFLTPDPTKFKGLVGDCVTVIELSSAQLDEISGFPEIEEIIGAAEDAVERGQKYGFAINNTNALEVMVEELGLVDKGAPACLADFLAKVVLNVSAAERQPAMRP